MTRPAYGFANRPAKAAIVSAMKTTADAVAMTAPAMATGCRTSASSRRTSLLRGGYFRLRHVRHQARRCRRPEACRTWPASAASWSTPTSSSSP